MPARSTIIILIIFIVPQLSSGSSRAENQINPKLVLTNLTDEEITHSKTDVIFPFEEQGVQNILIPKLVDFAKKFPYVAEDLLNEIGELRWYETENPIVRSNDDCALIDSQMQPIARQNQGRVVISRNWFRDKKQAQRNQAQIVLHEAVLSLQKKASNQCETFVQALVREVWSPAQYSDDQIQKTILLGQLRNSNNDLITGTPQWNLNYQYQQVKPQLESSCQGDLSTIIDLTSYQVHSRTYPNGMKVQYDLPDFDDYLSVLKQELPNNIQKSLRIQVDPDPNGAGRFKIEAGEYCQQVKDFLVNQVLSQNPILNYQVALPGNHKEGQSLPVYQNAAMAQAADQILQPPEPNAKCVQQVGPVKCAYDLLSWKTSCQFDYQVQNTSSTLELRHFEEIDYATDTGQEPGIGKASGVIAGIFTFGVLNAVRAFDMNDNYAAEKIDAQKKLLSLQATPRCAFSSGFH